MKKTQAIIYKVLEGAVTCLCLKRSQNDGGFWHVLTGTNEQGETDTVCLRREINEELGGLPIVEISHPLRHWKWERGGPGDIVDISDYAVEVRDGSILLNEEHDAYVWTSLEEARCLYEKKSARELVALLQQYLSYENGG